MTHQDEQLARAAKPAAEALRLHPFYRGKVQMMPKCPVRGLDDFAIWYTPGVASACQAIARDPGQSFALTNRANTIAVVSDGSRVLGLGDIGPEAGMPVMEGKALLFKYLGGVDAVPLCLGTSDADGIVRTVQALEPSFGGINLEDIAQPKCFAVLDRLRAALTIPVWHDDQQGTATVVLAGLMNALELVGKTLAAARIAMVGFGAANGAAYRLLTARGADPRNIIVCDRQGTLHRGRADIAEMKATYADKWRACTESNGDDIRGGIAEALAGADVCLAFSQPGPGVIRPDWVRTMARDAVVFACANPVPEIWPWEAQAAGAHIVATGRSDFPNQLNNSLAFPGIFRGVLEVRARGISDGMAFAAANALAGLARERGLRADRILPRMDETEVAVRVAVATAAAARAEGLAQADRSEAEVEAAARAAIRNARAATELLMREGLIPPVPAA